MSNFLLVIQFHPSIPSQKKIISGKIDDKTTLLEGILSLLRTDKQLSNLLIVNDDIKPGYLLIANKIELRTTRLIYNPAYEDTNIRIIPIAIERIV